MKYFNMKVYYNPKDYATGLEMQINALKNITSWHKFPEQTPPLNQRILVFVNGQVFISTYDSKYDESTLNVTHWMHIPKPPTDV